MSGRGDVEAKHAKLHKNNTKMSGIRSFIWNDEMVLSGNLFVSKLCLFYSRSSSNTNIMEETEEHHTWTERTYSQTENLLKLPPSLLWVINEFDAAHSVSCMFKVADDEYIYAVLQNHEAEYLWTGRHLQYHWIVIQ